MSTVGKFVIYLAHFILLIPASLLQPLIAQIASDLYTCAGDKAATTLTEQEKMWVRYHLYVIDSDEYSYFVIGKNCSIPQDFSRI